jgi:hypothetical protein
VTGILQSLKIVIMSGEGTVSKTVALARVLLLMSIA